MQNQGTRRALRGGRAPALVSAVLLLLPALLLPFPISLLAQSSTTGAISGLVVDTSGLPLPDAELVIADLARGTRAVVRCSSSGTFLVPSLPPAQYDVEVKHSGFQPSRRNNVLVELGSTTRVDATLAPASISTAVTVISDPTTDLDDSAAATSTGISTSEIAHLPIDGRRWQSFALLTPEVNNASSSDDIGLLSFRGLPSTQNSSRIDGADDDQSYSASPHGSGTDAGPETEDEAAGQSPSNGSGRDFSSGSGGGRRPGAEFTFSQAAVREFRVVGQNYSAMYGHAAGGVITTVSKSGTSTLHGSVFTLFRESAWAATNPFSLATHYNAGVVTAALVKPDDKRAQFGVTIGGPLLPKALPDRLFYFYAFDAQRRNFPAISSPENPAFYSLSSTQRALLGTRGVSSGQTRAALGYLDSLTGTVPRRADQTVNFFKLDSRLNPRNQLAFQYNRARFISPAGIRSAPVVSRGTRSFGSQNISVDSVLIRWLFSRRSAFSNELRLHYNRDLHSEQSQLPLPQEPGIGPGGLSPEISIGPQGFSFGTPASIGKRAAPDEHRVGFAEVATLAVGRHLIQAGADLSYVRDLTDSMRNPIGTFHYDSGSTNGQAGGLVDWITDYTFNAHSIPNGACPSINAPIHNFCFRSFSQSFGEQITSFSTQEWSGFVQDRWRPAATLSLTAGLRYEYELLPLPQQPNAAIDAVFSARGATGIFPEDRNNLSPRVAAAWQPFGQNRGTIRVGYGLYFGRIPGATIRSALTETAVPGSTTRIRILPTTITGCPQVMNQGFGYPCTFVSNPSSGTAATTSIVVFDRRFRLPMVQQGSLSLEREIGHIALVSASYLLNLDRQLANSVDINIAPSTEKRIFQLQGGNGTLGVSNGETFTLPVYTQRVDSSFGPVTAVTSNSNATYNALVLEAQHKSRGGLQFRATWTWSKALDFGSNYGSIPRTNGQLDPFDVRYDKGLSSLNYPHKTVVSAIWAPETHFNSPLLHHLTAGWLLAPILSETSGRPYSYNIFGGTRLNGGHASINGSGGDVYLPTVGRNTLRLPGTFNLNLRLARDVRTFERVHIHAFAEAFNLSNHVSYSGISERAFLVGTAVNGLTPLTFQDAATVAEEGINARPFGTFVSSSSSVVRERQVQLGLRLDF